MLPLKETGLWIPILFLAAAAFSSIVIFIKKLRHLKGRERIFQGTLGEDLVKQLTAVDLLKQGKKLLSTRRYPEAAETLEKAVKMDPSLVDIYLYLGQAYGNMGKIEPAVEYLNRFLAMAKPYTPSRDRIIKEARSYLEKLSKTS